MSNIGDFLKRLAGTVGIDLGGETTVGDAFKIAVSVAGFAFEADDNTQRQVLVKNTTAHDWRLVSAEYVPEGAVTADNTNYSTVAIAHQAAPAAALASAAASMQTTIAAGTDDWVANTPEALTLSDTEANLILEAGEYAVVELDGTNGLGVDLPIGTWLLTYERI